jgi:hypothetical protein
VLLGCWQLLSLVPKGRAERCLLLTTLTKSKFQIFPATFYKTENAIPCPGTKLTIHCGLQPPAQITGGPMSPGFYCCGSVVRWETKRHSEEWRTQILFLRQWAQTCTCVWALNKGFTRYLNGSAGHQVTKMCSGYGVLTSELDCSG